nr:ABC transporter substrate-binding protein [Desulfobulbus rhabdoformis]
MRSFFTEATLKKPVVGSFGGARNLVNYENILSVAPDLFLHWPAHNTPNKHEEKLVQMGFPLMALNLSTLEHYPATYRFMGNLLNRAQRGATLADYFTKELDTLKKLRDRIPDAQRVRVYLAEGTDGLLTVTENSVHSEAIRLAGAINVHTQSSFNLRNKERISHEQVLLYTPDVILVQDRHFYASIFKDPRWRQLKAVQKQKVFLIPDFPFSWIDQPPSFLRLLGAKWLVHVLYPDLYPTDFQTDIDYFFGLFFEKKAHTAHYMVP